MKIQKHVSFKVRVQNLAILLLVVLNIGSASVVSMHFMNRARAQAEVLGSQSDNTLKQYENIDRGYSFSYPSTWFTFDETKNLIWIRNGSYQFDFLNAPQNTDGAAQAAFRIQVRENAQKFSLADWIVKQKDLPKFDITTRTLPSGLSAVSAVTPVSTWKARVTYFVALSDSVVELSFFANSATLAQQELGTFEEVVSSFAASSRNTQPLQTYQNGIFGFLLDYPSNFRIANDNVTGGVVAFTAQDGTMTLETRFGGNPSAFADLQAYAKTQPEFGAVVDSLKAAKVQAFDVLTGSFSENKKQQHVYFVATSRGYFTLRVSVKAETALAASDIEKNFLDSFRVYEVLPTKGWTSYTSGDGAFTFLHPSDASIKDVSNGVEVTLGTDPTAPVMGMYQFDNFDLPPLEWIDNRQLNKYRSADSEHLLFHVASRVSGKDALRTADAVGDQKIVVYVNGGETMYVIDLKPFDSKNVKALAAFNTILETLKILK